MLFRSERHGAASKLHDLEKTADNRLEIETVDNNENGNYEIYRDSKAALNMLMRSFAARHAGDARTLLLMAPGWVRTDLGDLRRVCTTWITWVGKYRGDSMPATSFWQADMNGTSRARRRNS